MRYLNNIIKGIILGLTVAFAVSVGGKMDIKAADRASYHLKTYDKSESYTNNCTITDTEKYTLVVLEGDTDAVKIINKKLKKICQSKLKGMPAGYAEEDSKHRTTDENYSNVYKSKVTYNNNGVISIAISYEWYQGGVSDYGVDGYTFDLNTGKQLKLTDVCDGTNKTLTKKIQKKLNNAYGADSFEEDLFNAINAKKVDFYLKPKKAIVCFDKYEIAVGAAGAFSVTLPSKYE